MVYMAKIDGLMDLEKERARLYMEWMRFLNQRMEPLYGILSPNSGTPTEAQFTEWESRAVDFVCQLDGLFEKTQQYKEKVFRRKTISNTKKTKGK